MTDKLQDAISEVMANIYWLQNVKGKQYLDTIIEYAERTEEYQDEGRKLSTANIELFAENKTFQAIAAKLAAQLTICAEEYGPGTCHNFREMNEALIEYEEMVK